MAFQEHLRAAQEHVRAAERHDELTTQLDAIQAGSVVNLKLFQDNPAAAEAQDYVITARGTGDEGKPWTEIRPAVWQQRKDPLTGHYEPRPTYRVGESHFLADLATLQQDIAPKKRLKNMTSQRKRNLQETGSRDASVASAAARAAASDDDHPRPSQPRADTEVRIVDNVMVSVRTEMDTRFGKYETAMDERIEKLVKLISRANDKPVQATVLQNDNGDDIPDNRQIVIGYIQRLKSPRGPDPNTEAVRTKHAGKKFFLMPRLAVNMNISESFLIFCPVHVLAGTPDEIARNIDDVEVSLAKGAGAAAAIIPHIRDHMRVNVGDLHKDDQAAERAHQQNGKNRKAGYVPKTSPDADKAEALMPLDVIQRHARLYVYVLRQTAAAQWLPQTPQGWECLFTAASNTLAAIATRAVGFKHGGAQVDKLLRKMRTACEWDVDGLLVKYSEKDS